VHKISVVIPVYNEEMIVHELIIRVKTNLEKITEQYEILLIDDGSEDLTWDRIEIETKLESRVKALRFSRNFGHHYAITAGIKKSSGDYVVIMDGDLQDNPEAIPLMFKRINENYDVVFVNRINRPEGTVYLIAQQMFYWILGVLSGIKFDRRQANFSIISRKVANAFLQFPEQSRFYVSTIKWLGFNSTSIEFPHGDRFGGNPSYTIRKRLRLAFDIIFSFSNRPLKFSIYLGSFISVISFFTFMYLFIRSQMSGFAVLGWASLMCSIFFTSGLLLVILGIHGLYIGGIFHEVKRRPLFVISEDKNF
jgi:dolichol-phosphate mannosyltransferase